nr:MAG TPA: hypothetical protein [Caudoviricetes sp.]
MNIFDNSIRRFTNIVTPITRKEKTTKELPLAVGLYTQNITTEAFDFLQMYYHGGGVYTAVSFVLDNKQGLRVSHGKLVEDLLNYPEQPRKVKKLEVFENPINGKPVATNLRIKTIGTFAVNDDSALKEQLVTNGIAIATFDNKTFQLIDARHSDYEHELGIWYSPTSQFTELRTEPNGDFIKAVQTVRSQANQNINVEPAHIAQKLLTYTFPILQKQLFYDIIQPCLATR